MKLRLIEKGCGILAIVGFVLAVFFFNRLTGQVAKDFIGVKSVSFFGIFFIIKGLVFGAAWLWLRKRGK